MFSGLLQRESRALPRLVVGLNQVDKIIPAHGWDTNLNAPTAEAEKVIRARCRDIIAKLSGDAKIAPDQIEYYSATKRYRLLPLLSKIIKYSHAGFKFEQVRPEDPFDLASEDVREFVREERRRRAAKPDTDGRTASAYFLEEMRRILSAEDFGELQERLREEQARPPRVAILGQSGVGKTTTVNSLFNAGWRTSHTTVGTLKAQVKEAQLPGGGPLIVMDLPGYGRSIREDTEYEKTYRAVVPTCDLILLVMQANYRAQADDQAMLRKLSEWLGDLLQPLRPQG
jgi:predicted GTPase